MPPQMPNRSSFSSAYSRHSARTSQLRHTRLASRVEPPFSGKNASGSVCAHSALSCQPWSSTSSGRTMTCASGTMTSDKAHPPLSEPPTPVHVPARTRITPMNLHPAGLLRGLVAADPDAQVTVIGSTGDDITLQGLRVCPDRDRVMYPLGGGINPEQGWGRADESFAIRDELAAYGAGPAWFTLGDRDFATDILRTQLLATGKPLSEVTRLLCDRWQPGVRLLPMSDDRIETTVTLAEDPGLDGGSPGGA